MSVNRFRPHVLVLPEDDANRDLVVGFMLSEDLSLRSIDVLEPADGWEAVLKRFNANHSADMERFSDRHMILVLDFDEDPNRLATATSRIPDKLRSRVFILGAWNEPEALKDLKRKHGSLESIGKALAQDCRDDKTSEWGWGHPALEHNTTELDRLRAQVRPILFHTT